MFEIHIGEISCDRIAACYDVSDSSVVPDERLWIWNVKNHAAVLTLLGSPFDYLKLAPVCLKFVGCILFGGSQFQDINSFIVRLFRSILKLYLILIPRKVLSTSKSTKLSTEFFGYFMEMNMIQTIAIQITAEQF